MRDEDFPRRRASHREDYVSADRITGLLLFRQQPNRGKFLEAPISALADACDITVQP
jgi:hypothetical protein